MTQARDAINFDNSYAALGEPLSVAQPLKPVAKPSLIRANTALATTLGIDHSWLTGSDAASIWGGNMLPTGANPVATAYAGHQFGHLNPSLGDGRALLLGEVLTPSGERFDLQLKGSGPTPWSRGGDGRSPLGPVLREYIVSEAMAALGVPSTRALAAVSTGENVTREGWEPGAILTRVASSHLRIGTLVYFAIRDDRDSLSAVVEHALARHYPDRAGRENPALELLNAVIDAQAALVARWQLLGFVHGVMNTDNMLLCGETVDYGPCAFMEAFSPTTVFSSIDTQGRYAYGNQPAIAQWNLARLAEALLALIDDDRDQSVALASEAIQRFPTVYDEAYRLGLAQKLGLRALPENERSLGDALFTALEHDGADFTLAFSYLTDEVRGERGAGALFSPGPHFEAWLPRWRQRLAAEGSSDTRADTMAHANPMYIARNHLVQRAITDGEVGDYGLFHRLVERLKAPGSYDDNDRELALPAEPQERVLRTFCGT